MRLLLIALPFVVGALAMILTVIVVGSFMPRDHTASATVRLNRPVGDVWTAITDFDAQPAWRKGLAGVERLPDRDGRRVHRELSRHGPMTMIIESAEAPSRLVKRIADESLPFGGTWTFELSPDGDGARLTITEEGFVKPAMFRYIGRIIGQDSTIKGYLSDLTMHLSGDGRAG
jgi:uncharacterized protein YndB with AHSA1/START domain